MPTLLAYLIIFLAAWAASLHTVTLAGGSLTSLLYLFPLAMLLLAGVYRLLTRRTYLGSTSSPEGPLPRENNSIPSRAFLALLVPASLYFSWPVFWTLSVLSLIYCLGLRNGTTRVLDPHLPKRWHYGLIACLCALGAMLTLATCRPDLDDAYYGAVAAFTSGHPHAPLLAGDPMLGEFGLPLLFPSYRFSAFEVLPGAIAYLTGTDPMDAYYILLPPLWAAASVIVMFLLAQELAPRKWVLLGALSFALTLLLGEMHRSPANFSFVRIFQGKAVFLSVMVPAIYFLVCRYFSRRGSAAELFLLACCQIASIGLSNFGMLAAPIAMASAMAANLPHALAGPRRNLLLAIGVLAIPAPYLLNVLLDSTGGVLLNSPSESPQQVWSSVFGGAQQYVVALLLIAGPLLANSQTVRWRLAAPVLILLLLYLNPWLAGLISKHLTTPPVYWRVVWSLPVIIFCGAGLCTLIERLNSASGSRLSLAALLLAVLLLLSSAPLNVLRSGNASLTWAFATQKIPVDHYKVAERANELSKGEGRLLAAEEISGVISRFKEHPRLILSRKMYLDIMADSLAADDFAQRLTLYNFVTGSHSDLPSVLDSLAGLDVQTVVIQDELLSDQSRDMLHDAGYSKSESTQGYSIYHR